MQGQVGDRLVGLTQLLPCFGIAHFIEQPAKVQALRVQRLLQAAWVLVEQTGNYRQAGFASGENRLQDETNPCGQVIDQLMTLGILLQ